MAASYPGAIKSFTPVVDDTTEVVAAHVNDPYLEITAIETELGTDVAGSVTDLKTRLAKSLDSVGRTSYPDPTELTIASGSITVTLNNHSIDTQGDAATDDLDTITGPGTGENWTLFLHIANDGRNVVLKHNTGNLYLPGGVDATLDLVSDLAICQYDNVLDKWLVITTRSAGLLTGTNTWTGYNRFNYGMGHAYNAITGNLTLTSAHYTIDANATSGAITVTLPAAATYTGITYVIRKSDASANTVTIDGDGSETINGSTTKVLSNQYDAATIQSTGAAWIVIA